MKLSKGDCDEEKTLQGKEMKAGMALVISRSPEEDKTITERALNK